MGEKRVVLCLFEISLNCKCGKVNNSELTFVIYQRHNYNIINTLPNQTINFVALYRQSFR